MPRLRTKFILSALSLVFSLLIMFSARAQTTTTDPQTTCTGGGGKWCLSSGGSTSGYCSYSTSPCPAYDSASCSAQNGEWCAYSSGSGGYCNSVPGSCPINDQATCESKSRKWCAGTSGGMGWCATTGSTCPANDATSCAAQNGEWCTSSYGGTGYCNSVPGTCPINDKATCESKSRTWCVDTYSSYCASTGSTCPSTSNTTASTSTHTYTPTTYSWPNTESDCTKYKGVWCTSTHTGSYGMMSGSCMTAGQTCPVATPAGKMSCWDGSFVDTYSSCPTTPSSKNDCDTKGYKWCESTASTYSSSGWCTGKTSSCPTYPPAGKMSCPDGVTFATTLTECPTGSSVTQPTTKTCPDGSTIASTATCPVTYKVCPDGSKVETTVTCPVKTEDQTSVCLGKGGKWCLDKTGGTGYCVTKGDCSALSDDNGDKKTEQPFALDAKQIKLAEAKKKEYLRSLDTLEKTIKRFDDQESLAKVAALKQKLAEMPIDSNVFDALEAVRDDVLTLREVKDNLIANQGEVEMSERDKAMQVKALKQLQKNIARFSTQLNRIQAKVTQLEKQKFLIPSSLKEMITQGKDLAATIKNAKNFEEARDAAEALAEVSEDLNLWTARLEQLIRVNQFLKVIQSEINKREAAFKSVQALIKRLKVDLETYMGEVRATLDLAKEANSQLKTREWGEEEPLDFIQESIIDKLENADEAMANVRALANLKASVNKTLAQIRRYDASIARLVRQKKDVAELKELVAGLKDAYNELKALAGTKLADLDTTNVLEKLGAVENLTEEINDLLKISAPSALEKALRGGLKVEKIEIPEIEREVIRAYRVATFFRRAPQQMAEYASSIKEAGVNSINRWRNRLAID